MPHIDWGTAAVVLVPILLALWKNNNDRKKQHEENLITWHGLIEDRHNHRESAGPLLAENIWRKIR